MQKVLLLTHDLYIIDISLKIVARRAYLFTLHLRLAGHFLYIKNTEGYTNLCTLITKVLVYLHFYYHLFITKNKHIYKV